METEINREFPFTDKDFECIRALVKSYAGIALTEAKRDMVYSRLARRLRVLNLPNFAQYCRLVESGDQDELGQFVNALTTNLTFFFRENHHFLYLAQTVIPERMKANETSRKLRIWSAGCSTGEEPYSLAIVIQEGTSVNGWDAKILATDLDTNVLATAQRGIYDVDRMKGVSPERLRRFFRRGKGNNAGFIQVSPTLKEMITFKNLNLMNEWPMRGPFDVIFCRNVVIYFDKPTQQKLFDRFAEILAPDGFIFVGHSESLYRVTDRFDLVGNTTYRKRF